MKKKRSSKKGGFDYKEFEKSAIEGLQSGQGLVGENGLLKKSLEN